MAVKQIVRFEASDGTLFTEERAATKYQDSLNNRDRSTFRRKTFDDFVNGMIARGTEEQQILYTRLVKGDIGYDESQSFFETIWLGQITNTKTNQRLDYSKLLTTIIGNDETHIKADGIYDLSIGLGAKTIMLRGKGGDSLSTVVGEDNYVLAASPGGFTMTKAGVTVLGTAQFVDNRWSVTHKDIVYTVAWQAGL